MSRLAVIVLVSALGLSGCIENMGDLKEALGVVPEEPPAPVFVAPLAKATANASLVGIGQPVRFAGDGSKDPQGLELLFLWDLGGKQDSGPVVEHSFQSPGQHTVRLRVTNAAGLTDEDVVLVQVSARDLPPSVALAVADAGGVATSRGAMGVPLSFEASGKDPEGSQLAFVWEFGDGATARGAEASHAFSKPGRYDVRVVATDAAGSVAEASTRVAIDGAWRFEGSTELGATEAGSPSFPVAAGAQRLLLRLSFEGGFGLNDLEVVLVDAAGTEVARSAAERVPGAQGQQAREVVVDAAAIAGSLPGAWTARVVHEAGAGTAWVLDVTESFSPA